MISSVFEKCVLAFANVAISDAPEHCDSLAEHSARKNFGTGVDHTSGQIDQTIQTREKEPRNPLLFIKRAVVLVIN